MQILDAIVWNNLDAKILDATIWNNLDTTFATTS